MAVAPATRRDSGGVEARAPIRRRRAHSHRPGLCSDKWGASCPDVWSRGRQASPRPPSEGWRSWSYEAGPAAVNASARSVLPYMPPPAATPQPSPHMAVAPATALAGLVPRPRSERCRSWSYEAGPAAVNASAWSVLPYMPPRRGDPATLPPQSRRASDPLRRLARPRRSPCLEKTLIASPICGRSGQLHFSAKKIR